MRFFMYSVLLAIIYLSFISLGLPDSLLGSGWPVMQGELDVPLSYAGIVSMIVACGTIVSSLASDFVTRKLNAGLVTAISVGMTAAALFGFSVSNQFWMLCLWAVPYGLGAGAVDAALNNYVALHYSSRHMSWLHAFWGVGVSISPYIMGYCLSHQHGWQMGYRSVSLLQIVLTAIFFASLSLWKKRKTTNEANVEKAVSFREAIGIPGVKFCLISFFGFCALEATAGLWAASYMVGARGVDVETAARFAALFYLGETGGRFLNGFVADRFGDKTMIKTGIFVMLFGVLLLLIPLPGHAFSVVGLLVIGLGAAPVYPCIIHSTPINFGAENSQALVGIQMASAYIGSTLAPPVFGLIAEHISISLYPIYLGCFAILMLIAVTKMNRILRKKRA